MISKSERNGWRAIWRRLRPLRMALGQLIWPNKENIQYELPDGALLVIIFVLPVCLVIGMVILR